MESSKSKNMQTLQKLVRDIEDGKLDGVVSVLTLAGEIRDFCPNLGKDGHNHPANPCTICEGFGYIRRDKK